MMPHPIVPMVVVLCLNPNIVCLYFQLSKKRNSVMTKKQYKIKHVGWLLACDSPKNIQKGWVDYHTLNLPDQRKALQYRDECWIAYNEGK